jgi:hypothetical protein
VFFAAIWAFVMWAWGLGFCADMACVVIFMVCFSAVFAFVLQDASTCVMCYM